MNFREQLIQISNDYYRNELALEPPPLPQSDKWYEFAHTPQIPHIGIARVFRYAQSICEKDKAVYIYAPNDHLPAAFLPESRYIPLADRNGVRIRRSPLFGLQGRKKSWAMFKLPSPNHVDLEDSLRGWNRIRFGDENRISELIELVTCAAEETRSYSAWLTRVTFELLKIRPLIFPTSKLREVFTANWQDLQSQMWYQCSSCGYRLGRSHRVCRVCTSDESFQLPDVVGRQVLMNQMGFALRICGAIKPYQALADQKTPDVLGVPAPPRCHVSGPTSAYSDRAKFLRLNLLQFLSLADLENLDSDSPVEPLDIPLAR